MAHFTTHLRIVPQHKTKEWADVRFRRAVSMAINRKEVIEVAYSNFAAYCGTVAWDVLGRQTDPLLEDLGPYYQYNPEESRRLLQEAGYAPNSVEVQYHVTSATSTFATLMEKYLADVGIRLKIDEQQSTVLNTMRAQKNYTGFVTSDTVTGMSVIWELLNFYDPASGNNWGSINDPVLWDYIQKAKHSTNADEARRWLLEVEKHELENLNDIYVVSVGNGGIWQPWLGNVANNVRNTITSSGSWAMALAWITDKAPDGRGGRRAV
jgi:ABC-type transport system substrate-binding protein